MKQSQGRGTKAAFKLFLIIITFGHAGDLYAQSKARFEIGVGGGYGGSVRWRNSQADLYEGLQANAFLGFFVGPRSEFVLNYSYSDQKGNYSDLVPEAMIDRVASLSYRRFFGNGQAFLQLGGDYDTIHTSSSADEVGYGTSFGGGLNFKLVGRMYFGVTTLYAWRTYKTSNMTRRFLTQTLDLKFLL